MFSWYVANVLLLLLLLLLLELLELLLELELKITGIDLKDYKFMQLKNFLCSSQSSYFIEVIRCQ